MSDKLDQDRLGEMLGGTDDLPTPVRAAVHTYASQTPQRRRGLWPTMLLPDRGASTLARLAVVLLLAALLATLLGLLAAGGRNPFQPANTTPASNAAVATPVASAPASAAAASPTDAPTDLPTEEIPSLPPETYTSPTYGFSFQHPAGWTAIEDPFGSAGTGITQFSVPGGSVFVSIGTATQGPPIPCTDCGRFKSKTASALAREVADRLLALRTGGPYTRATVPLTTRQGRVGDLPGVVAAQTYPDVHGNVEYVATAFSGRRPIVIAFVPDIRPDDEEQVFNDLIASFRLAG